MTQCRTLLLVPETEKILRKGKKKCEKFNISALLWILSTLVIKGKKLTISELVQVSQTWKFSREWNKNNSENFTISTLIWILQLQNKSLQFYISAFLFLQFWWYLWSYRPKESEINQTNKEKAKNSSILTLF